MSVTSTADLQATFVATVVDEWIRDGLREAVVCPGSRSAPLALALAARPEIACHVRIDERSAGFFAIGRAKRTARPVLVVVTSGTAATELHAAVAEASLGDVPLIVATADRPPELHGVGAPQTVRQRELFGPLVRRYEEPGVAREEARETWRPLAARLYRAAADVPGGPTHLNCAFVEPLVGRAGALPPDRAGAFHLRGDADSSLTIQVDDDRVLVVAGQGAPASALASARARGWVVLGDATTVGSLAHFDAVLREDGAARRLAPRVVVRLGGVPASKVLGQRLVEWAAHTIAVSAGGDVADPDHRVAVTHLVGSTTVGFAAPAADRAYVELWGRASGLVEEVAAQLDPPTAPLSEPSVARTVVDTCSKGGWPLVVGSSMPVRDVEWWAPARTTATYANRGVNGIDGVSSTVLGVATGGRAVGLLGDVSFLHDVSALTDGLGSSGGSCALVVVDNQGGGIFAFLPQYRATERADFERLFATARGHDAARIAEAFGHRGVTVSTNAELRAAIEGALQREGLTVVRAVVPVYDDNVVLHDELNRLASQVLAEQLG